MISLLRYAIFRIGVNQINLRLGFPFLSVSSLFCVFFLHLFSFFRRQQIKVKAPIIMDKLQFVPIVPLLEDINMVDPEGIGFDVQGDVFEGVVVQKADSALDDVGKRGKSKLDCVSEEFKALSKRVEILERRNVSEKRSVFPKQLDPEAKPLNPVPAYLVNFPISARLRKAFEWLAICKSDHINKGSSGFSEETIENRVNFAESLVNAEILLELVRTKKELQTMKDYLRDMDVASKVEDTPSASK